MMLQPHTDKPVLIIQHEAAAHPGTLLESLVNAGLQVDVRQLHAGTGLPGVAGLADISGLVVLGGSMNTDQAEEYPFLDDEQRLLAVAVEEDVPVLGICLGGQQVAAATGGEVYRRDEPEVGWLDVDIVRADPIFDGVDSPFRALEWHAYSFTAPATGTVLATRPGDRGVQAFRVGRRAWGVQFHAEVDENILEYWIRRDNKGIGRRDPELLASLRERLPEIVASSRQLCRRLAANFAAAL